MTRSKFGITRLPVQGLVTKDRAGEALLWHGSNQNPETRYIGIGSPFRSSAGLAQEIKRCRPDLCNFVKRPRVFIVFAKIRRIISATWRDKLLGFLPR